MIYDDKCPICDVQWGGATDSGMVDAFVLGAAIGKMCHLEDITVASVCCERHRSAIVQAQFRAMRRTTAPEGGR